MPGQFRSAGEQLAQVVVPVHLANGVRVLQQVDTDVDAIDGVDGDLAHHGKGVYPPLRVAEEGAAVRLCDLTDDLGAEALLQVQAWDARAVGTRNEAVQ